MTFLKKKHAILGVKSDVGYALLKMNGNDKERKKKKYVREGGDFSCVTVYIFCF